jgi:hypothetical protein
MANSRERRLSPEEMALVTAIVSASGLPEGRLLLGGRAGAVVSQQTEWILDVKASNDASPVDIPNGPYPARAFVPSNAAYQGEVIVWIENGYLSGLEFAWVTDEPPTRWPRPDEMEVVASSS